MRSRIGKLVHRTISKIEGSHRLLGVHLSCALRTGHVCRYEPPGRIDITWHL
jgi:hypothetical protein